MSCSFVQIAKHQSNIFKLPNIAMHSASGAGWLAVCGCAEASAHRPEEAPSNDFFEGRTTSNDLFESRTTSIDL